MTWQELQNQAWEELNYRRNNRICARCGTSVFCYIKEVKKYEAYVKDCKYNHRINSIDDDAATTKSGICTSCGTEIVTGFLGSRSKRVENNEDAVIDKLQQIRRLCRDHKELEDKNVILTNRMYRDGRTKFDDESEGERRIKESEKEMGSNKATIVSIELQIDDLVNLYRIK